MVVGGTRLRPPGSGAAGLDAGTAEGGLSEDQVNDAVRIAATVNAASAALAMEEQRAAPVAEEAAIAHVAIAR